MQTPEGSHRSGTNFERKMISIGQEPKVCGFLRATSIGSCPPKTLLPFNINRRVVPKLCFTIIAHDDAMKISNTINVRYDGNSLFHSRTAKLVKRLDHGECIHLTNVADRKFVPQIYGKSQGELAGDIYAQLPDGTWLQGADAFRELFAKTGLRPIAFLSKVPLLKQVCNIGYCCLMYTRRVKRRPVSRKPTTRAAVSTTFSSGTPIGH